MPGAAGPEAGAAGSEGGAVSAGLSPLIPGRAGPAGLGAWWPGARRDLPGGAGEAGFAAFEELEPDLAASSVADRIQM